MKVKDIMVADVMSVTPEISISEVADIIFRNRFHGLPVIEDGKVIGIITEDDFFMKNFGDLYLPTYIRFLKENRVEGNLPKDIRNRIDEILEFKAGNIMTRNCITIPPEMDVSELMETIKRTHFTTFPVVNFQEKMVGIITLSDIIGIIKKGSSEMRAAINSRPEDAYVDKTIRETRYYWKDRIFLISKMRIRTWKGSIILAFIGGIVVAILCILANQSF
jgi:CBS domain-containing protein